jgi:predicted phosphodiesterase
VRLGIISDIHGSRIALEACLAALDKEDLDDIVCLGDVVGYGPEPQQCIDIVREREWPCVIGNHDVAVTSGQGLEHFNPVAQQAALWARDQVAADGLSWLAGLPRQIDLPEIILAHGAPGDTDHYVVESYEADEVLAQSDVRFVVVGHTHLPVVHMVRKQLVTREVDFPQTRAVAIPMAARALLNPGSVGQPRDGVPDAAFGILDSDAPAFTIVRVPYDIEAVATKIVELGLPEVLGLRLLAGR